MQRINPAGVVIFLSGIDTFETFEKPVDLRYVQFHDVRRSYFGIEVVFIMWKISILAATIKQSQSVFEIEPGSNMNDQKCSILYSVWVGERNEMAPAGKLQ